MRILSNSLAHHTSFKTGGEANQVVAPDTIEELLELVRRSQNHRILGNGSNTLALDEGYDGTVIKTTTLRKVEFAGDLVRAETGISMPALVRNCAKQGLGGCEYLISVPGTVGGGVFMNAGRGKNKKLAIADHVISVEIFDGRRIQEFSAKELRFSYRYSRLHQEPHWIVLNVTLKMVRLSVETILRRIHERIGYVQANQDRTHPNAGTIFSRSYKTTLALPGRAIGGAEWSSKTANWINNKCGATSRNIIDLIREMQEIHRTNGYLPPVPEIKFLGNNFYNGIARGLAEQ